MDAVERQKESGNLIERDDGKYTTKSAIECEKEIASHLEAGRGAHNSIMTQKEFDTALKQFEDKKGFQLGDEQRAAAGMILTEDSRFQGVQGLAGTGKTTMLEFVKEAAESKGWEVKGMSNGGAQADKMQAESGIKSQTNASFIGDHESKVKDKDLAQRALATHEQRSSMSPAVDLKQMREGLKDGSTTREYDSQKREYLTDNKSGKTYCADLYAQTKEIRSENVMHAGLTESVYRMNDRGQVFRSGGSITSEIAGKLNDHVKAPGADGKPKERTFAQEWKEKATSNVMSWEKARPAEAIAVKMQMAAETKINRAEALSGLKEQASSLNGEPQKVLYVADEASMSGARETRDIINVTEATGAKQVSLGDSLQHQAVAAGGKTFETSQEHMPMSYLGEESIKRQKTDHAKETVATILEGRHAEATSGLPTKEISSNQDAVREKYNEKETLTDTDKSAMKSEIKEAAKEDNKKVIKEIARDYSSLSKEDRAGTMIVSATNADRTSINEGVRENLKEQGELKDGKQMVTIEGSKLTESELKLASNYEKGQTIEFTKDYKTLGVEKGDSESAVRFTVTATDSRTNTITAQNEAGREIKFNPEKIKGKTLGDEKVKEFAEGDKVAFTKNDRTLDVKNGQTGTVEKFDGKNMSVKLDNGEMRGFDVNQYKNIDHAYAVTSFKSQGQTVNQVMVHHNTAAGQHGDREAYVNYTRAREDVKIYTQDASLAAKQSSTKLDKDTAQLQTKEVGAVKEAGAASKAPASDRAAGKEQQAKGSEKVSAQEKTQSFSDKVLSEAKAKQQQNSNSNSNNRSSDRGWDTGR